MNQRLLIATNLLSINRNITYCRLKQLKTSLENQLKTGYHSTGVLLSKDNDIKTTEDNELSPENRRHTFDIGKHTTSDAHIKHKAYQNFRCKTIITQLIPKLMPFFIGKGDSGIRGADTVDIGGDILPILRLLS